MKISTILDYIDSGHMALPEFQRGYVWNRDQVKGLFDSLYRRHPVGSLLVWATESNSASYRGDGQVSAGVVKLLLDGQQRMTSLYGVVRGEAPTFFDGNNKSFTDLYFHLEQETFNFHQPNKMANDPLWIDVTDLMKNGHGGLAGIINNVSQHPHLSDKIGTVTANASQLLGILEIELHIEEVSGEEKTIDVVVDIFNRVNSGGTKLSKGDLALAKICADWPEARDSMKDQLKTWKQSNYSFNLDWYLRSINTVVTGEARFQYLHNKSSDEIQNGLNKSTRHIDTCLNMISGRLGLDHDRVFFAKLAIPVMVYYLFQKGQPLTEVERDKLLFWYMQSGMWGRFSGSTESYIDQDVQVLAESDNDLDKLIEQLRLWHGGLKVEPGHFKGWSLGARFYPVLYWLTRMGEAKDWGTGLPLRNGLLGRMNQLEVHHIFPKAQLYKRNYQKDAVNALANYCFLTKDTNIRISDRLPEDYFPEIEERHPGSLASQWIPGDPELWKIENFLEFQKARQKLLADEANRQLEHLLHNNLEENEGFTVLHEPVSVPGSISDEDEEQLLLDVNEWMEKSNLPLGEMSYSLTDDSGIEKAIFDLAWPNGIQEELSEPVVILLNEPQEVLSIASQAGFRFFTSVEEFREYVENSFLSE